MDTAAASTPTLRVTAAPPRVVEREQPFLRSTKTSSSAASLRPEQTSDENTLFSLGRCLRCRRRDVLRAAWRLITDVYAGLCCGLDAHSHVARLRRRHRRYCLFADWPLDDALSPAASIAERG